MEILCVMTKYYFYGDVDIGIYPGDLLFAVKDEKVTFKGIAMCRPSYNVKGFYTVDIFSVELQTIITKILRNVYINVYHASSLLMLNSNEGSYKYYDTVLWW